MFQLTEHDPQVQACASTPRKTNRTPKSDATLWIERHVEGCGRLVAGNGTARAFRLLLARSPTQRERARKLVEQAYRARGYTGQDAAGTWLAPHRTDLVLLAEDHQRRALGTVGLVYDSEAGLPCDEIFRAELAAPRAVGRRMAEVTGLAFASSHRSSKALLVALFNCIYIHARLLMGWDDFVIEVNPRHCDYYRRLLGFKELGAARPCPRVRGAPAVLLSLDLSFPGREIERFRNKRPPKGKRRERSLYGYFLPREQARRVADFMRHIDRTEGPASESTQ